MAIKKHYEPLVIPAIPNPTSKSPEVATYEIEEYLEYAEWCREENTSLKRISYCGFLKGMLNPFASTESLQDNHFSWCPSDQWKTFFSQKYYFQDTDEALEDFENWRRTHKNFS